MADIIVDTYKLNQYAQRIAQVNGRITRIDRRLDSLYWQVGLQGLFDLLQADLLTGYSWRLSRCKDYLQNTAADFEKVEKSINYDDFKAEKVWKPMKIAFMPFKPLAHITYDPNFPHGLVDKINEYIDIINSDGDLKEKAQGTIGWLSSIRGDASTYKDYVEWLSDDEFDWPKPIDNGFDFIKALDTGNKLIFGALDYGRGLAEGDVDIMSEGADGLLGALKGGISFALKTDNAKTDFGVGILLDFGKNMVTNWIDSIKTETKVSEVYWNTFANSAMQVFNDTVCNAPTLAIAYKPAKMISGAFGFDLQGAYEKVSDKKGFAAVTDSFSQLSEIFMENSTWENWKSGMGVIGDSIKGWFK